MEDMLSRLLRVYAGWVRHAGRHDRTSERGDVPGWVMVTVMTAGLVAAIWAVAGPELERMLRDALGAVS